MNKFYIFIIIISSLVIVFLFLLNNSGGDVLASKALIKEKIYEDESIYSRSNAGINRGFQNPTNIKMAPKYIFVLQIEGEDQLVSYSLNTILSDRFKVGQNVSVKYIKKNILGLWGRVQVLEMNENI